MKEIILSEENIKNLKIEEINYIFYSKKYNSGLEAIIKNDFYKHEVNGYEEEMSYVIESQELIIKAMSQINKSYNFEYFYYGLSVNDAFYFLMENTEYQDFVECTGKNIIYEFINNIISENNIDIYINKEKIDSLSLEVKLEDVLIEELKGNLKVAGMSLRSLINLVLDEGLNLSEYFLREKIKSF